MEQRHGARRNKIRAISLLCTVCVILGGFAVQGHLRAAEYRRILDNNYRHAFTELTTAISEVDSALQKSVFVEDPALCAVLCAQTYGKALSAQMALGELPYGNIELEQTAALLAKTGDYAMALARQAPNRTRTAAERKTLQALSVGISALNETVQSLQAELNTGALTPEDLSTATARLSRASAAGAPILAGSAFQRAEAEFPEMPTLLYDGPFSDLSALSARTPRMLEGQILVSEEEARAAAARFLGFKPEIFTRIADCGGALPTWAFSAQADGGEVYVSVTKAGGLVAEVLSSRPVRETLFAREDAVQAAAQFLQARGYPNMAESYLIEQDHVLTVNFAARQGDVICYPDLVKVSVALDTGKVVGFAAEGYLMHHTTRALPAPTVSCAAAREVREQISPALTLLSSQIALIPTPGGAEILCYEFKCEAGDGRHCLVYVNAQTGRAEKILLLLEDENGTLVI